jgi:O-antigen ligase
VGIGNYAVAYPRYALPQWSLALGHAHNYYLNISAEAGALGLLAYLVFFGAALITAWRATRWFNGWWWGTALGVLGVVMHLAVHNVFDNLYVHGMYLHLAMLLGVIATHAQDEWPV